MATITRTFTENAYTSDKSTWTITLTGTNVTVSSSEFAIPVTCTAKYVGSNKGYGSVKVEGELYINNSPQWTFGFSKYENTLGALASGTTYTIPKNQYNSGNVLTQRLFNATNKNSRTFDIIPTSNSWDIELTSTDKNQDHYNYYRNTNSKYSWNAPIATITLNAPPILKIGTPTYSEPHYNGYGTYTVPITQAMAQYNGNITSIKLTVGTDSVAQTYAVNEVANTTISLTPTKAGIFTPTITATDSRGQTSTQSLAAITVNQYNIPSVSFDVYRTNQYGVKADEGEYALIKANFAYTSAVANLTAPSVTVTDQNGNTVTTTTTWYSDYDADDGVDPNDEISDWTTISSGAEVYGLTSVTNNGFSILSSYSFTITETDTQGKPSNPITQTLSTAFYTIDFQAGGKEIAFGGPANDDLTAHENGLFKCNMDAYFAGEETLINNPYFPLDTTASSGVDYDLYRMIVALNWQNDVIV